MMVVRRKSGRMEEGIMRMLGMPLHSCANVSQACVLTAGQEKQVAPTPTAFSRAAVRWIADRP